MTQCSLFVRNARLDAQIAAIGASPVLELRSGPPPRNCAETSTGLLIAAQTLPASWMTAAAHGLCVMKGPWLLSALIKGTIGHFRLIGSNTKLCHMQGTASSDYAGDSDMIVDSDNVEPNQSIVISMFQLRAGNP